MYEMSFLALNGVLALLNEIRTGTSHNNSRRRSDRRSRFVAGLDKDVSKLDYLILGTVSLWRRQQFGNEPIAYALRSGKRMRTPTYTIGDTLVGSSAGSGSTAQIAWMR
jgi:hypothetical protein